jgi:hypothetical protein
MRVERVKIIRLETGEDRRSSTGHISVLHPGKSALKNLYEFLSSSQF